MKGDKRLRRLSGALNDEPAFVFGNGPDLPLELSQLDEFFTIGVNRILLRYEPTVVMWMDEDVARDQQERLDNTDALCITRREIKWRNRWWGLQTIGHSSRPHMAVPPDPSLIPATGSTAVSAAYWAASLGCRPVFLLGMSGRPGRGGTNFYGDNPHHTPRTLARLRKLTHRLMAEPWAARIHDAGELRFVARSLPHPSKGRAYYAERITGVRPGQRARPAE